VPALTIGNENNAILVNLVLDYLETPIRLVYSFCFPQWNSSRITSYYEYTRRQFHFQENWYWLCVKVRVSLVFDSFQNGSFDYISNFHRDTDGKTSKFEMLPRGIS